MLSCSETLQCGPPRTAVEASREIFNTQITEMLLFAGTSLKTEFTLKLFGKYGDEKH